MNPLRFFLEWRDRQRRARIASAAERERAAIIRAKASRRERHMAFRHLDGALRDATCRAIAAECGRDWRGVAAVMEDRRG